MGEEGGFVDVGVVAEDVAHARFIEHEVAFEPLAIEAALL
jgi:hypothetical protein